MAIEKTHWFLEYLVVVQKIIAIFARDNKKNPERIPLWKILSPKISRI
jgi:hypothetical protein